jgi:hypothetical protein
LQNGTIRLPWALTTELNGWTAMIDRKAMENDLIEARRARQEAEEANCDVEELIWELQHVQLGRQRIVFSIAGFEQDGVAN